MFSIIISLISGAILALAFPRMNAHWVAWFALTPLMHYTFSQRWGRVVACGFAFGMGFFGVLLYWIEVFGKLPWFALAAYQSVFVIGFVVSAKLLGQRLSASGRLLLLPALWVIWEWIRSLGSVGFTWGDIGYSQYKELPVIQMAAVTGVWGVTFLLALCNAGLANLLAARGDAVRMKTTRLQMAIVLLIIALALILGRAWIYPNFASDTVKVAVVQGNIEQGMEIDAGYVDRTWRTYTAMTLDAANQRPDIIVWPETVVPGYGRDWFNAERLKSLSDVTQSTLLVGGWDQDSAKKVYNAAFLVAPQRGIVGQYAKVHLVPFGEYVPCRKQLPFLQAYHVTAYDTSSGSGFNTLRTGKLDVGTAICFESIFQDIPRTLVKQGASVLCVITNDCWYDETAAAEQHMAFSVFRAVENRRWLVRGATTGISCVIDPYGRIVSSLGVRKAGIVRASVESLTGLTFFTRYGEWVLYISWIVVLVSAWCAWRTRRFDGG